MRRRSVGQLRAAPGAIVTLADWMRLKNLWKSAEAREMALAELRERETNPAAIAKIEKQKRDLAAWQLKHALATLDRLDEAERSSMFAPWRAGR